MTSTSTVTGPAQCHTPVVPADELNADLHIGCRFLFDVPCDVHAVVLVEPHSSERHRVIGERFESSIATSGTTFCDSFGNRCRRLRLPAGQATFTYDAIVTNTDHTLTEETPLAISA